MVDSFRLLLVLGRLKLPIPQTYRIMIAAVNDVRGLALSLPGQSDASIIRLNAVRMRPVVFIFTAGAWGPSTYVAAKSEERRNAAVQQDGSSLSTHAEAGM